MHKHVARVTSSQRKQQPSVSNKGIDATLLFDLEAYDKLTYDEPSWGAHIHHTQVVCGKPVPHLVAAAVTGSGAAGSPFAAVT